MGELSDLVFDLFDSAHCWPPLPAYNGALAFERTQFAMQHALVS